MMHLDLDGVGSLYMQVYRAVRAAIHNGTLAPGTKLLSTRALAKDLRVSRNVVLLAYAQLLAEGYVQGHSGSGSYVLGDPDPCARPVAARPRVAPAPRTLTPYARALQTERRFKMPPSVSRPQLQYDFRYGNVEMSPIARREWGKMAARHERRKATRALSYADPQGDPALRATLSSYLRLARGLDCAPEQIVITHGTQEALDLTMRTLVTPRAAVVLEHPHYLPARLLAAAHGARIVCVPTDRQGMQTSRLPQRQCRLAYVTPSHQFPLGGVLPATRRAQLLAWAQRSDAMIFEDDYDSEFRFDAKPVPALYALDSAGRTLYGGTFSKVLSPGLRLGYVVLPEDLVDIYVRVKMFATGGCALTLQQTLAEFIDTGHFQRHVLRMRRVYAERRQRLLESVHHHLATAEVVGEQAGLQMAVWLSLPASAGRRVVDVAADAGVGVDTVNPCYVERPAKLGLLLSYASIDVQSIDMGMRQLAGAIDRVARRRG